MGHASYILTHLTLNCHLLPNQVAAKVTESAEISLLRNTKQTLLPPANEVWGKVIFLHLFVILFTGGRAWLQGGHAWLQGGVRGCRRGGMCGCRGGMRGCRGGMRGCTGGPCVVAPRGACVVAWGGMRGCLGGCAWLLGGVCVVALGGCMHGCSGGACMVARGACMVLPGGVHGFFHEIRSMSGWYASYWNAFLYILIILNRSMGIMLSCGYTLGPAYNEFGYKEHLAVTSRFLCIPVRCVPSAAVAAGGKVSARGGWWCLPSGVSVRGCVCPGRSDRLGGLHNACWDIPFPMNRMADRLG